MLMTDKDTAMNMLIIHKKHLANDIWYSYYLPFIREWFQKAWFIVSEKQRPVLFGRTYFSAKNM